MYRYSASVLRSVATRRILASRQARRVSDDAWKGAAGLNRLSRYGSFHEPGKNKSRAAWQPDENIDIQRVTQVAMIHELTQQQVKTIEQTVPWFLSNMPASYFRQVPESFRQDHIKAISALRDANMKLHLNLQAELPDGRTVWTYIREGTEPGLLLSMVKDLPHQQDSTVPLSRIHVYSTRDETMSLNMFVYGKEQVPAKDVVETASVQDIIEYAIALQQGQFVDDDSHPKPNPIFEQASVLNFIQKCDESYLRGVEPRRFLEHIALFDSVSGTENLEVHVEQVPLPDAPHHYWVDIVVANSIPQQTLESAAHLLHLHRFDIARAQLDVVDDGENGDVTLLRLFVCPLDEGSPDSSFERLKQELKRVKWLDPTTMNLVFDRYPWLGVRHGEIITAFCSLLHPVLSKVNAMAFSKANILNSVTTRRYIPFASSVADLFLERFDPENPLSTEELAVRSKQLRDKIESDVEERTAADILNKMIDIVGYTLKTNIYLPDRYALGLRLDPIVMESDEHSRDIPYGVIFAHGRRFNAYHVRFKDVARGGMRLVTPNNPEQQAIESSRQYDEVYGLAFAQQLKNKDIPEGGSKAVNLIDVTNAPSATWRNFVVRKSVKAFADTILDMVVDGNEEYIVDYLGKKEVIYLGPDEQVIPEDINWIIKRAELRGYDTPNAFMSSKPRSGINHKEYGVTSEGVNVYVDVALRHVLGIDPKKDEFTVKMSGGTGGDVAGNEIRILLREYGDNVKIVGVADHSACAEDPNGLDHAELLRLVENSLDVADFDKNRLGDEGKLYLVDTKEGTLARNSMHNRLKADVFIPAGGRPGTIDESNWRHFLTEDGKPSAPLIVEGANLFLTAEARQALFDEAGVVIVKDSSANKGGVITSSYEICAAMLLSEEEFFENKEQIVDEVLAKLRKLAKLEADLLFREFDNYPGSLPHVSQIISNTINLATDALTEALEGVSEEQVEELLPLFRDHLPPTISQIASDRIKDRVPAQYVKNAIASCLASKLVYKEGSRFIEAQPRNKLAKIALAYLEKEKEIAALKESVAMTEMPEDEKAEIIRLLDAGGARTLLNVF